MRDDKTRDRNEDRSSEEITVPAGNLVDKVKDLIHEGNVRRVVVRRPSGEALVEIPLTAGVGIAGLLTLLAPVFAALAAMAALIAQFRVEIERERDRPGRLVNPSDRDED
ncbi:MAG: DUF4342 domain-containing protein [Thiocapsa sp.]|jgi:hypothetical protein|nr:DUF4342 domain-containing protein [Thiocapsa sp.]MCG6896944.1 DUF4342 domain-containing protein [Thiocapsa sp.]MCG6986061.1 DUF4342 domain-containing protein [Thiocapsa sp.]